jgi:hypothetical protein
VTRAFLDDLRSVGVSRLRASGTITAEMTRTTMCLADVEVEVGLSLQKFRNGGSWSPSVLHPAAGSADAMASRGMRGLLWNAGNW